MGFEPEQLRREVAQVLVGTTKDVPVSAVSRLRRTAMLGLRGGTLAVGRALTRNRVRGQPDVAALAKVVSPLAELKGIAMKLGQMLSYLEGPLPPELRCALSALQTHAHPVPTLVIRERLKAELGDAARPLLANLSPTPVAVASIAQIHRSTLDDGTAVAVKVQYPDIEKAIRNDLGPAALGSTLASFLFPSARIDTFVSEARARFLEECDYPREARCQQKFADIFADHEVIDVAEVHRNLSTQRVLTTTWVDGKTLEQFIADRPTQDQRDRVGRALFEFYLGTLFEHGAYNGDPHPGNYLFTAEGKVAMLDFGCVHEFDSGFVDKLAALTHAVHADERNLLERALIALGILRTGQAYDYDTVRAMIRSFYGPMLRDEVCAFEAGSSEQMRNPNLKRGHLLKLALPGEFLFLLRVRIGLASILERLGARANWRKLEHEYVIERAERVLEQQPEAPPPLPKAKRSGRRPRGYDVILIDPGESPIQLLRELRAETGLGLREAKDLVEEGPRVIQESMEPPRAEELKKKLEDVGGTVELRPIF